MSIIQAQPVDLLEGLAIVLSVVSLIITAVGFFASLKFYRDGVELQNTANRALTKLEEKTDFIQSQVGGMFDKTLDAAIGKRELLADQFEELNEQLESTKKKLIEESIGQIGAAGEQERKRLSGIVDRQMALIREKVESTRESAQEILDPQIIKDLRPRTAQILSEIAKHPAGTTIGQLSEIEFREKLSRRYIDVQVHELMRLGLVVRKQNKIVFANKFHDIKRD